MLQAAAGFVQYFTERHGHRFQVGRQTLEGLGGQGGEQVVLERTDRTQWLGRNRVRLGCRRALPLWRFEGAVTQVLRPLLLLQLSPLEHGFDDLVAGTGGAFQPLLVQDPQVATLVVDQMVTLQHDWTRTDG